jgi:hypothetical protein
MDAMNDWTPRQQAPSLNRVQMHGVEIAGYTCKLLLIFNAKRPGANFSLGHHSGLKYSVLPSLAAANKSAVTSDARVENNGTW